MTERGIDPNELEDDYDYDDDLEDVDDDDDGDEPDDDEQEFQSYGAPMTPADTVEYLRVVGALAHGAGWNDGDGRIRMPVQMRCRGCGCSDHHACPGGCVWAAPNLCSRCA